MAGRGNSRTRTSPKMLSADMLSSWAVLLQGFPLVRLRRGGHPTRVIITQASVHAKKKAIEIPAAMRVFGLLVKMRK